MAISLEDQRAYKTACLQAAATLLAHHRGVQADECLKFAKELYEKATGDKWS